MDLRRFDDFDFFDDFDDSDFPPPSVGDRERCFDALEEDDLWW